MGTTTTTTDHENELEGGQNAGEPPLQEQEPEVVVVHSRVQDLENGPGDSSQLPNACDNAYIGGESSMEQLLGLWWHIQSGDYKVVLKHYLWKKLIWPNFFIFCLLVICFFVFLFCGIFVWDHFTWEAWYALSVTVLTFCMLIKNLYDPSVTMILSTTLLVAAQIVPPKDAISGTPSFLPLSITLSYSQTKRVPKNKNQKAEKVY